MVCRDAMLNPAPFKTLAVKWSKDADAYQKIVEEARRANTPHEQMLSLMTCYRLCAKELDTLIKQEDETK